MRLQRAARGQAMVEMAVAFPLLVFVALGLVQFSLYVHAHNVLETAVQEAARAAAAQNATLGRGEARGNAIVAAGWAAKNPPLVHVQSVDPGTDNEQVEASISAHYPTFFPSFSFAHGIERLSLPITATARLYKERFRNTT